MCVVALYVCQSVTARVCVFLSKSEQMAVWLCARLSLRHVLLCYNVMLLCVECICFGSVRFAHSLICQSTTFRMCVVFFFNQLCTRLLLWGTYVSSVSNTKYVVTIYKLNFFSSCGISKSNKTRTFVTATFHPFIWLG